MNTAATDVTSAGGWLAELATMPAGVILLLLVALVASGLGLYGFRQRRRQAPPATVAEDPVALLRERVKAQASALLLLSERVAALEEYLELVGSKQQRLEQDRGRRQHSYRDAIGSADRGASPRELMSRHGLSVSEADLIAQLYGGKTAGHPMPDG